MAKCHRYFPAISAASLRSKLLQTISCSKTSKPNKPNTKPKPSNRLSDFLKQDSHRSDSLSDLLRIDVSDSSSSSGDEVPENETKGKVAAFEEMRRMVKDLQSECEEKQRMAATEVRRMAKSDCEARELMAMLGAIPPLIGMIENVDAIYALLNIGIGNDLNKAAIVKAGAVPKMLDLIKSETLPSEISEAIAANLLSLSALNSNKPIIGSYSYVIPFLIKSFKLPTSSQSQQDSLCALFNLSISQTNIPSLTRSGLVPLLLSSIGDMNLTDWILAILANIVSTSEGRREVTGSHEGITILVDVLNWIDSPKCQEKAVYILMVIAFKSEMDRHVMVDLGIKSALLELALVGSALAQKRSARILEILSVVDKGKQVSEGCLGLPVVSAPLIGGDDKKETDEKRAVRELVNESLEWNLKRIVRRANRMKELGGSNHSYKCPSKSLPF